MDMPKHMDLQWQVSGAAKQALASDIYSKGAVNCNISRQVGWPVSDKYTVKFMGDFYERAIASGDAPTTLAQVQKEMLLEFRKKNGTKLAVQLYGPFIMSFQGTE